MLIILQKEMMVVKNQVGHVRAERDVLATAEDDNRWLTVLHYSFSDETHLYMVMEYLPGGDLMSLLMREDTFSEEATKFLSDVRTKSTFFRNFTDDDIEKLAGRCGCFARHEDSIATLVCSRHFYQHPL